MKKMHFLWSLLFLSWTVTAQVKDLGTPLSFSSKVQLPKNGVKLPYVNNQEQVDFYAEQNKLSGEKVMQYGFVHEVDIDFFNEASKQVLPNGKSLYQLRIESTNAVSLNVIFNQFQLAEGTVLYIFAADKSQYVGAYTSLNNNQAKVLGTELINSDQLIIEIQEPIENENKSILNIGRVVHGFTGLQAFVEKLINTSGDCNIDVNCPQGSGWELPRNGVAMIVNGTGGFCTGSMVNNTAGTTTPYFLTAAHCGPDPSFWIFRFRWESPQNQADCGTSAPSVNGPEDMNINGAVTRAYYATSDFHLLELNATPSINWDVIYNGWDHSGIAATSGAGIHHPSGDIKKISISSAAYESAVFAGIENHWRVYWSEGVTQGGSSGSPIFDQNRRIVGQLHGGFSGCSSTDQSDLYGKFSDSWIGGGTPATRLSDWLDPTNTGVPYIDANVVNNLDPFFSNHVLGIETTLCTGTVDIQFILTNGGSTPMTTATINYTIDGNTQSFTWNGSLGLYESDTVSLPTQNVSTGSHILILEVLNPNGTLDENMNNNTMTKTFYTVVNGSLYDLNLTLDCYAHETSWELIDANNVVLFESPTYVDLGDIYTVTETFCLDQACYDFVIYDVWGDGMTSSDCDTGSYTITNSNNDTLLELTKADADFGSSNTKNFCTNLGLETAAQESSFIQVYPNPFLTSITVHSNDLIESIVIFDLSGKEVFNQAKIDEKHYVLDTNLNKGMYTIRIKTSRGEIIKKLTKTI